MLLFGGGNDIWAMSRRAGTPATGHLTALEQTATSWRSDNEASARIGTSMARKLLRVAPEQANAPTHHAGNSFVCNGSFGTSVLYGGGNVTFAEGAFCRKPTHLKINL